MRSNKPAKTPPLREALYALSMAKHVPDAQVLDDVVRRYPQFADELTDFAVELVVDSLGESNIREAESNVDLEHISPDVSRAISRFHNRVYALRQEAKKERSRKGVVSGREGNPFANLSRTEFRAFAERIGANTAFVAKLRDRQIQPDTMTDGFKRRAAVKLGEVSHAPEELVYSHLAAKREAASTNRQFYKADSTPREQEQQSFEDAVRSSGLTKEQQRRLLSL